MDRGAAPVRGLFHSKPMSLVGTNAKCRSHQVMSEFGGEPENIYSHGVFRILTQADIGTTP
jgi:hypothetical protein